MKFKSLKFVLLIHKVDVGWLIFIKTDISQQYVRVRVFMTHYSRCPVINNFFFFLDRIREIIYLSFYENWRKTAVVGGAAGSKLVQGVRYVYIKKKEEN